MALELESIEVGLDISRFTSMRLVNVERGLLNLSREDVGGRKRGREKVNRLDNEI